MDAADADVRHIHALTGWESEQAQGAVTLADIDVLRQALRQISPRLIVVDPLQAYLGARVDMHRANETRPILAALSELAEEYVCAVLCLRHLGKAPKDRAVYRGLGSIDLAAAARSILLAGQDSEQPQRRVMAHVKSSLAPLGASLGYELREGRFSWTGLSPLTADALLASYRSDEERHASDEAAAFLRATLKDGTKPAKEVMQDARMAGIAEITIRRAKKAIGVQAHRQSVEGGARGEGDWVWSLAIETGTDK